MTGKQELLLTGKELDAIADASGEECLDFVNNAIKAQLTKVKQHLCDNCDTPLKADAQKQKIVDARREERERIFEELMADNITEAVCDQFSDWMAEPVPFNLKADIYIRIREAQGEGIEI